MTDPRTAWIGGGEDGRERYEKDPQFRALVDMMLAHIMRADFTPGEMRLAAMMAAIFYEQKTIRHIYDPHMLDNFERTPEGKP